MTVHTVDVAARRNLPGTSALAWLLLRFGRHPKSFLVGAATILGSVIVLHHFFQIGYLPVLAISDLFGIVLAAAAMGAVLLFAVVAPMLLPGYVLIHWAKSGLGPRTNTLLRHGEVPEMRWKYRALALLTAAAAIFSAVLYICVVMSRLPFLTEVWIVSSAVPPFVAWISLDTKYRERFVVKPSRRPAVFFFFQAYCYGFWWALIGLVVLIWRDEGDAHFLMNAALLIIFSILLHILLLAAANKAQRAQALILGVLIGYFLATTGTLSIGADKIVSYFDLGQVARVDVMLNRTGCDAVNAAWSKRPCVVVQGGSPQAFLLPEVDLITRIGPHYLIGERGAVADLDDRRLIRIAIRSEDVLGWSRVRADNPPR